MIQLFADKYKKLIAYPLFVIFYLQTIILPLHAAMNTNNNATDYYAVNSINLNKKSHLPAYRKNNYRDNKKSIVATDIRRSKKEANRSPEKTNIGGPSSPEATSFKAVGSDNLVNLFTGDFSYSIPLLDVGGYPVNLFYSGGITMEQEASWVGLGWNINPGSVSRNMRGVPDDFNGDDKMIQTQNVKPNRTWGGEVGINGELLGIPKPKINLSLGFSYNNYLGPALDIGAGVSLSIPITQSINTEKGATPKASDTTAGLSATVSLNAKLSSRSGLTFSPSLNASLPLKSKKDEIGIGLSTSYNSRQGIKELNLSMSTSHTNRNEQDIKDNNPGHTTNGSMAGSSISFARPSYIPTLRMPMQYANYSGQLELGAGMFGIRGGGHAQGYYSESKVPVESRVMYKPLVGFMYSEKANGNKDAVMDFNRLNDAEVTPRTPILSAPQYAYDVFSIQGEGTGGSIRAYRGDLGFMRDNETTSKDNNISIGFDIAPAGHYGGNWNIIHTPTRVGGWEDANNTLRQTIAFNGKSTDGNSFENVYFRNPGEATVTNQQLLSRIGGDNLVRFKLSGSNANPRLESVLEQFNKNTIRSKTDLPIANNAKLLNRDKRTQVTTMLTGAEASQIGLEKKIRNYSGGFNADTTIQFTEIDRTFDFRKKHHISEINVLEQSGMRYVYGLPVYSLKQKDFTFSVGNIGDPNTGIVNIETDEPTIGSHHMENKDKLDGYVMTQEIPAYASSFLLTGLLSPDYVDVSGDGITEDDLGSAVKFDYTKSDGVHKWRTPRNENNNGLTAHFNEGLKSEKKDNKATISYGEREVWYMSAIESKSMIAIFKTESREDAKGVKGELDGRVDITESVNKRLKQIDLYTKAEIKAKGIANARPIKTVNFRYSYTLCNGTPDNAGGGGKLTLDSIFFSYNGQTRNSKDKYAFNYGKLQSQADNPSYANTASDKWGTYKKPNATDSAANPGGLTNAEYPYTSGNKTKNDEYAAAWSLKKILLPGGGQMEVQYEADDYAYVQNRRACDMFNIYGLGNSTNASTNNGLYNNGLPFPINTGTSTDNFYVYIKLPQPLQNTAAEKQKQEILDKYLEGDKPLQGMNQLAFKLLIDMPKGPEPLTVYTKYDDYGLCTNSPNKDIIYIKLQAVDGKSPLSKSAIGFITENLPGQAFEASDIEVDGVKAFLQMMGAMLGGIKNAFKNVDEQMRSVSKAKNIYLDKSFVRLNDPYKKKYGGGVRVKKVIVKDNWQKMLTDKGTTTYGYTSTYGQEYDYTTIEKINGKETAISSGVASYEPGLGSEENPFREIVSFSNKMPLASAQYGAIEMPMLDGLYPSPGVGYSKITVRSIHRKGTHSDSALRSAIGKQVTEYYTAKEFPCYSIQTPIASMDYHFNSFFNFLYKDITDRKVTSQGFLVETNDMHGKIKSQIAYSESDEKTPLSYSYHSYKNTGKNGLTDRVDFVNNELGGAVAKGNMGIDIELMTDVREFRVQTQGFNGQIQTDFFWFFPPVFGVFMLPLKSYTENKYRSVTCTKLINYHAIEDSVIVMDKGSVISTKTIAYDAESGTPVVTKTANEFKDPVYNVNYPAYWAYSGMGLAYKNIGMNFKGVNFYDGKIISGVPDLNVLESGDELYLTTAGSDTSGCVAASPNVYKLWAFDKNKNTTALTVPVKDFIFIDSVGRPFTKSGVSFKILRSGKRNNLSLTVSGATCMNNPIQNNILVINNSDNVVAASAVEYKEKWQVDNDVILKKTYYTPVCTTVELDSVDCNGILEKNINPYTKGLIGNFKPYRNYTYYGSRNESDPNVATAIRKNGWLSGFNNYWGFNAGNNLVPDTTNAKWVWNSELTKVNSKGQELETKNALGIYTAAQYGFNKTTPVAIANNSRYNQMFSEGFEDKDYNETLNGVTNNTCAKKHIDLSNIPNSPVISANNFAVNAHSGKNVLQIPANGMGNKILPVTQTVNDGFNLLTEELTTQNLVDIGGNIESVTTYPVNMWQPGYVESVTNFENGIYGFFQPNAVDTIIYTYYGEWYAEHNFTERTSQYVNINTTGDYDLFASVCTNLQKANTFISITDLNDNTIGWITVYPNVSYGPCSSNNKTIHLCPGIYKVKAFYNAYYNTFNSGIIPPAINIDHIYTFSFSLTCGSDTYKTLSTQNGCTYTKPIPASENMINPTFALQPDKKMQFSAWVQENCGNAAGTPCFQTSYNKSSIDIQCNGISVALLKPTGPIIEGWQKIEGEFTVPQNTTSAQMVFINSNNKPMYVDDIRIHPFNANMKSYVYDPVTLRLSAELDENNYASFYEYDEEGQLVRVKKETIQGIKTIKETRASKQKAITDLQ